MNFEFSWHWNKPTTKSQADKLIDLALEANLEGRSAETPDTSNLSLETYCDHHVSCVMSGQEGTEEPRTSIYFCRTMISTLGPADPFHGDPEQMRARKEGTHDAGERPDVERCLFEVQRLHA